MIERAKSMCIQVGLTKQFQTKAINTVTYLINQGPLAPLEHKILEEVWTIKELKLFHLKVFDCGSYVHISDHGINKFDSKSIKCSFIGYGANVLVIIFGITRIRM